MNPVPVVPDCDRILTKIRASNAERQRRYQERGGKNQRRPHDHRDDVILELKDKVLDLREEIRDLKREIRELKLNQRDDVDNDTDSEAGDIPPQPPHHHHHHHHEPEPEQYVPHYEPQPEYHQHHEEPEPQQPQPEYHQHHEEPEPQQPQPEYHQHHEEPEPQPEEQIDNVIEEMEAEIEAIEAELEAGVEAESPHYDNIYPEPPDNIVFEENPLYHHQEEPVEAECHCQPNVTTFTLPVIIKGLKEQEWESQGSLDATIYGITTFFRVVECDNIPACLVSFENVKLKLETAKQVIRKNELYSNNSKKAYIQAVLTCITRLKIPVDKDIVDKYKKYFELLKMQSAKDSDLRRKSPKHAVLYYPDYLRKIKEQFGETSKQYLISRMYAECTCRDNFGGMKIVASLDNANDDKINYLVINDNTGYFVLHKFKTSKRYGTIQVELSDGLITLLKNYIDKHKLTSTLFPENRKNGLSDYLSAMNKKIGVNGGGVNPIRHMMVETILSNENVSDSDKYDLSTRMGHSPHVQTEYRRILQERQESETQYQDEAPVEDEETRLVRLAVIRQEEHEALERENDERRANDRRIRIERERQHADQPEPKKQKTNRGQGEKRKGTNDDSNTKKQKTNRGQGEKRKGTNDDSSTKKQKIDEIEDDEERKEMIKQYKSLIRPTDPYYEDIMKL